MIQDPATTDPDKYKVVFENDRVRVLEYKDNPGEITNKHHHPDVVTIALTEFDRKLHLNDKEVVVHKKAGEVGWQAAQEHRGENIGATPTHVILVELK